MRPVPHAQLQTRRNLHAVLATLISHDPWFRLRLEFCVALCHLLLSLRLLYKSCMFYAPMQQDWQLPKQPHTLQVRLIQIDWNFAGVSLWGSEACCGQSTVIRHRHSRREGPAFFRIYLQVERRAFYDYTVPWQTLKLLTTLRLQLTACLSLSPFVSLVTLAFVPLKGSISNII